MSAPVIALVAEPTAAEERKRDVVERLRVALAEAERGEIDGLMMVIRRPDGHWLGEHSQIADFPDAIGRFEIIKHSWIAQYNSRYD